MALIFLLGRLILGAFLLDNAWNHFKNADSMAGYAASKGVKKPKVAVVGSGVLLLIAGLSIITGLVPGIGVICLVIFLIGVTFTMHTYWKETDENAKMMARIQFMKNMALLGSILMIAGLTSLTHWPYTL